MSKYEVDDFVTPPDPDLICCICRSVLYKPLESPCQHVFCKDCINTWLSEHRSCPSCRKHLSNSRLKPVLPIVRNMINRLLVRCKNESRGCSKGVKLEVIEQHAKECEFALVGCLNTGCIKNVLRKDMLKHEKECPYRLVKCKKGCGLPVTVANMKEHNCIQSLKNSMQAMEQTFNQRFKDLEDKLIQSRQEVTERVSRVEQDLLDEIYDSDVRINALRSELQRHGYSLSRSLSGSRSRSRSYSRSPNRSPSHSPRRSHSNSRSRSQSPSYDSHSRDESSDRGHTDSSSNDWFRSYYEWESTSDETHEQYELPNEEPWHEGYSPDWSGRDSPYAEFSPAEEEDPPILEFTERTPWSTTRTQFFAPSGSRASQSTSDRSQSAQANRESSQVSNQLGQASSELASEGGLPPQRHSDSEESEPETSENRRYPLRIKIRRHAASSDAPELSASGPSQAGSADVAGSLYGIQVGDTDSDDEEWQPQDDTPSSDSSVTSTGDVEDDGQDLSGNENQIEASFRAARSTWTSSQRTRRAHDSGNHPTDRPSTSRQSANQEATGSERTLHRNASHSAEQTSSSRRRRRDRSDPEEDGAGRRSNKRAKRK